MIPIAASGRNEAGRPHGRAGEPRRVAALVRIAAASLPVMLAGCGGVETTVLPARIEYACADNRTLVVERSADAKSAAIVVDGRTVQLTRGESAAQEKYAAGRYALYLDGEKAMVEDDGRILYSGCASKQPLPVVERNKWLWY